MARRRSFTRRGSGGSRTLGLLIAVGADPGIKDDRGRDAIDIAKARRLPRDVIAGLERLKARAQPLVAGAGPRRQGEVRSGSIRVR
jgi:hypothetical protein